MAAAGVPVAPGTTEPVADAEAAVAAAERIGYPVMVKAAAGGGGIGIERRVRRRRRCARLRDGADPRRAVLRVAGDPARATPAPRPPRRGADPRAGRRPGAASAAGLVGAAPASKVAEETPSPGISPSCASRCRRRGPGGRSGRLPGRGHGRVAWWTPTAGTFVFLEMNTRLEVEHAVTRAGHRERPGGTAVPDAAGRPVSFDASAPVTPTGHASSCASTRNTERFLPSPARSPTGGSRPARGCGWTPATRRAPP